MTTTAPATSTGAALSGAGACILGHPIYLAAIVGFLIGFGGYHAAIRWRTKPEGKTEAA